MCLSSKKLKGKISRRPTCEAGVKIDFENLRIRVKSKKVQK